MASARPAAGERQQRHKTGLAAQITTEGPPGCGTPIVCDDDSPAVPQDRLAGMEVLSPAEIDTISAMAEFERRVRDGGGRLIAPATTRTGAFYEAIGYDHHAAYLRKIL